MDIEEELLGPVENDAYINDTPATSVLFFNTQIL